jgi:hypothetical protein
MGEGVNPLNTDRYGPTTTVRPVEDDAQIRSQLISGNHTKSDTNKEPKSSTRDGLRLGFPPNLGWIERSTGLSQIWGDGFPPNHEAAGDQTS